MVAACPPVSVRAHLDGQVSDAKYVSYSYNYVHFFTVYIYMQQCVATYGVCMENVPSRINASVMLAGKAKHVKKV